MQENKILLITTFASVGIITAVFAATLWLVNNGNLSKQKLSLENQGEPMAFDPAETPMA